MSQKTLFHAHTKSAAVSNTSPKQQPAHSDSEIQVASIWGFSILNRGLQNYSNWGKENWKVTHWLLNALLVTADPTFGHQGPVSWKTIFPQMAGGWFQDNSNTLHLLCALFLFLLHQLHLRLSGIRSQSLGTPGLKEKHVSS